MGHQKPCYTKRLGVMARKDRSTMKKVETLELPFCGRELK